MNAFANKEFKKHQFIYTREAKNPNYINNSPNKRPDSILWLDSPVYNGAFNMKAFDITLTETGDLKIMDIVQGLHPKTKTLVSTLTNITASLRDKI